MAVFGKLDDFDCESGDWTEYEDRLAQYFIANELDGDGDDAQKKRKAILLSAVGAATYSLVRKLCAPQKPSEKTFEELCTLLQEHQNPKPSVIVQRFRFNSRVRKQGESVSNYVAELRKLSEHCEYDDKVEEMIRDRIVCGVNHENIQRRLLSEAKLTFKKAVELATAMETALRDIKDIQGQGSSDVHKMTSGGGKKKQGSQDRRQASQQAAKPPSSKPCYRCGEAHHPDMCRFKSAECHFCKKQGHIEKVCFAKKKASGAKQSTGKPEKPKTVSFVDEEVDISTGFDIFTIESGGTSPLIITPSVAGQSIPME